MSAKKETAHFYCDVEDVQRLESEADNVNTANKQLQSDDEELISESGEVKKKKNVFRKIAKGVVKCLPQEKERAYEESKTHKQKLKDENKDWKERWENTEKEKAQLKSAYDREVLKSQIQQAQINDLERERKELLHRLSKLAGDTLTHDNSNIADLSDLYRPTILSDTYCELYDNEWTDAFQELTDHGLAERDAVEILLKILLMCFHKCREITWERYQSLKHIMSNIDIVHIPRGAKNLPELRDRDIGTKNASNELAVTYSQVKETLCSPQPKEESSNPDIGNNASNELEVVYSLGIELERPSQTDESEIKSIAEIFPLSDGSASKDQNEEHTTVENMMSVSNLEICNNASEEFGIEYSIDKEVDRPPQHEATENKGIDDTFPLSDGLASQVQNEEQTNVEHMISVSNPDISNNASKELGIAYRIDKYVDRPSQYEATEIKGIDGKVRLSDGSASKVQNEEKQIIEHMMSTENKGIAEIFPLSNVSASNVQNDEHTMVEHIMSVSSPDISNNGSIELGIAYSRDKEIDRPSQHEAIKVIEEIFPLSDGSASNIQNEEHTIVEQMMTVSSPDSSKNEPEELGIAYSIDKEIDRPSQHEAIEITVIDESASNIQNEEHTIVEQRMSMSSPEVSKNASTKLEIAYSIVDRPPQLEAVSNPVICTMNTSKELEVVCSGKREVQHLTQCKEEHLTSTIILRIDQEKQIKDIWRTTTSALKNEAVKHLYILILTSFDIPIKDMEKTSKYLTSCIDLCWKMSVQEKPMYLDVVAEKDIDFEKVFDQDKFKAYTRSGERVDFVVWPALFLNEGGPMIFKGIAQGSKEI